MQIHASDTTTYLYEKKRLLKRALKTLKHALTFTSLEAETRTEGHLAMAQTYLLLNEVTLAHEQAIQALNEAQQSKWHRLVARAQYVLGNILVEQQLFDQASQYFEQAYRTFSKNGMRLDYACTIQSYGALFLQNNNVRDKEYQRGLDYLQEALQVFTECKAELSLQLVKAELTKYEPAAKGA